MEKDYLKPKHQEFTEKALHEPQTSSGQYDEFICKKSCYINKTLYKLGEVVSFGRGDNFPIDLFEPLTREAKAKYDEKEMTDEEVMALVGHSRSTQ